VVDGEGVVGTAIQVMHAKDAGMAGWADGNAGKERRFGRDFC
jgi:hypothetical protein